VDVVPQKGGSRAFSLGSLFQRGVPRPFPEASTSTLKLISNGQDNLGVSIEPDSTDTVVMDGVEREIKTWNLLNERLQHKDIRCSWDGEDAFSYRELSHEDVG
jgi:hypothetical protein